MECEWGLENARLKNWRRREVEFRAGHSGSWGMVAEKKPSLAMQAMALEIRLRGVRERLALFGSRCGCWRSLCGWGLLLCQTGTDPFVDVRFQHAENAFVSSD